MGAGPAGQQLTVKLIAINDFHGYLQPSETFELPAPGDEKKLIPIPVGGVAYLAAKIAEIKAENPLNVVVGAGDMVGASPLSRRRSFTTNRRSKRSTRPASRSPSVGNHEFDEGRDELLRKQHGGCRPGGTIGVDTCMTGGAFSGAAYQYLAANVIDDATGKTLFPAYAIKYFDAGNGKKAGIAFIGVVLHGTPADVNAKGVRGLHFADEATTINALLPSIYAQGVHAVVVLIHEGIATKVGYDDRSCAGADGDLLPELNRLDPSVRLVISGHTHHAYICPHGEGSTNPHIYYTSAGRYGQIVSDIDVTLNVAGDTIANVDAHNKLVVNDNGPNPMASTLPAIAPVPAIAALVTRYVTASAPLVNRVVGKITADITLEGHEVRQGGTGESEMGDVIADARLAATKSSPLNAELAFINDGGVRSFLTYTSSVTKKTPGNVTFGEAYSVTPFGDVLYTETITGAKLRTLLDEQFIDKKDVELLGISGGLTYTWDASLPDGKTKIIPASVKINGVPVDPKALIRVTVDGFLVGGGDKFVILRDGAKKVPSIIDIDALTDYLGKHEPLAPPQRNRITRLN